MRCHNQPARTPEILWANVRGEAICNHGNVEHQRIGGTRQGSTGYGQDEISQADDIYP